MASQKQTEANRLNAQKSTGPRGAPSGPEGKAASSMNALKSGIDAKSQIILGGLGSALPEPARGRAGLLIDARICGEMS